MSVAVRAKRIALTGDAKAKQILATAIYSALRIGVSDEVAITLRNAIEQSRRFS